MSLNYSKFDRIVDSDDEDDGDDVRTGGGRPPAAIDQITRQMPPHLYRKLTEAQMAASSGDHVAALRAQQELSAELERGPPEFKAAFMRAQALHDSGAAAQALASRPGPAPVAASSSSTKPTSQMTRQEVQATLHMAQAKQTATLKHLEQVEKLAGEDPAEMMKFMDGLGLTPEMVEAAERSDDPDAMRKLAEKMVAATMGGARLAEMAVCPVCRRRPILPVVPRARAAPPRPRPPRAPTDLLGSLLWSQPGPGRAPTMRALRSGGAEDAEGDEAPPPWVKGPSPRLRTAPPRPPWATRSLRPPQGRGSRAVQTTRRCAARAR